MEYTILNTFIKYFGRMPKDRKELAKFILLNKGV